MQTNGPKPGETSTEFYQRLVEEQQEFIRVYFNRGSQSNSCAEWGYEPDPDDTRPMQRVYPVRHGIGCKGHRELIPPWGLERPARPVNCSFRPKEEYL